MSTTFTLAQAPVLVYCGNVEYHSTWAKEIDGAPIQVTNDEDTFLDFCAFKKIPKADAKPKAKEAAAKGPAKKIAKKSAAKK